MFCPKITHVLRVTIALQEHGHRQSAQHRQSVNELNDKRGAQSSFVPAARHSLSRAAAELDRKY